MSCELSSWYSASSVPLRYVKYEKYNDEHCYIIHGNDDDRL